MLTCWAQTSPISGQVVDDLGTPISGATISYATVLTSTGSVAPLRLRAQVHRAVVAAADGTFVIPELPVGTYALCAFGTAPNHLDSCQWSQGAVFATVGATASTQKIRLITARGTLIKFQVLDAKGQIVDPMDLVTSLKPGLPAKGGNFRIGLVSGSHYVRATLISTAAGVRQYQVPVSKEWSANLVVDTALKVLDSSGNQILTRQASTPVAAGGLDQLGLSLVLP